MSTLNVSNLVTRDLEDDLAFKTNNTTRMLLTSAGTLSGAGGSITNFTGVGKVLQVVSFTTDTISTTTSTSLANTAVTAAITPSLDSPNTTSEVDYYVTFLARSGYTTQINRSGADADQAYTYRGSSTITLMEISG